MLTSASQYLHPDYLQPLPTTLDAKKSPLALLAQTCSSIGKDTTPSKSIIPPLEKSSKDKDKDSNSHASNNGDSKPNSPKNDEGRLSSDKKDRSSPGSDSGKSGSFRAPAPKDIPPLVPISGSAGDRSPAPGESSSRKSTSRDGHSPATSSSQGPSRSPSASAGVNSNSRISLSCGNMLLEVNHHESAIAAAKTSASSSSSSIPSSTVRPEMPSAVHPTLGAFPHLGLGHSIEALAASSLASHHPSLTAHGLASVARGAGAPSISPYSYARVKTASGATTLVPICRDPYCTNCQITMHSAQIASACAAGCTQCTHEKSLPGVPTSLGLSSSLGAGSVPVLPFPPSPGSLPPSAHSASALHSLYPHAFGILPGHHSLPYVCNWMAGSDYCGKRFSNSEELLQHLRTHTSSSESALASLAAYPGLGLHSAAALAAAGCHSHLSNPPPSLSPNSIRQTYPRSLSPNTLLAASRYHPYKHLSGLPPAPSVAPAGLPSALSAYYSPYALYGQRLGAAAVAP